MRTVKKTLTLCVVIDSLHKEHLTSPKLKKKRKRERKEATSVSLRSY